MPHCIVTCTLYTIILHTYDCVCPYICTDLNDGVDVYEVEALYLVGFKPVGTLHAGQHCHYLLRQSTGHNTQEAANFNNNNE